MSAASGTQRNGARERGAPHAVLFHGAGAAAGGHLVFFPFEDGYEVVEVPGPRPEVGDELELGELAFRVLKVGIAPFPGDRRPCVFLERRGGPAALPEDLDVPAGLEVESSAARQASGVTAVGHGLHELHRDLTEQAGTTVPAEAVAERVGALIDELGHAESELRGLISLLEHRSPETDAAGVVAAAPAS
jgi:hypothetical protein